MNDLYTYASKFINFSKIETSYISNNKFDALSNKKHLKEQSGIPSVSSLFKCTKEEKGKKKKKTQTISSHKILILFLYMNYKRRNGDNP